MLHLHHQTFPGTSDLSTLAMPSQIYLASAEITALSLSRFSFVALPIADSSLLQIAYCNLAYCLQ